MSYRPTGTAAQAATAAGPISGLNDVAIVTAPIPNTDGTAALLTVVPQSGPTSEATEQLVHDLRELLPTVTTAIDTYVTGATAVGVDVATALNEALPIYLAIVVGLAVILLVLVFRRSWSRSSESSASCSPSAPRSARPSRCSSGGGCPTWSTWTAPAR